MHYTLENYEEAIGDTQRAIDLDPAFAKAYYRQGQAFYEMTTQEGAPQKAIDLFKQACQLDDTNNEMNDRLAFAIEEFKEDNYVPVQAEKDRFEVMFNWMREGGALFDKLKLRYYAPDYRGVHAARNIKKGETILYVPKNEIVTLEMAQESPIGA